MMNTLCDLEEPWFIPVAAVTLFLAPDAITAISCGARGYANSDSNSDSNRYSTSYSNGHRSNYSSIYSGISHQQHKQQRKTLGSF